MPSIHGWFDSRTRQSQVASVRAVGPSRSDQRTSAWAFEMYSLLMGRQAL